MKNVAVLVHNLVNDYNVSVVEGIISHFEASKDIRLIIATVNAPHSTTSGFDYQYWSSLEILKSKEIDGIISVTNSFLNMTTLEAFSKELEVNSYQFLDHSYLLFYRKGYSRRYRDIFLLFYLHKSDFLFLR